MDDIDALFKKPKKQSGEKKKSKKGQLSELECADLGLDAFGGISGIGIIGTGTSKAPTTVTSTAPVANGPVEVTATEATSEDPAAAIPAVEDVPPADRPVDPKSTDQSPANTAPPASSGVTIGVTVGVAIISTSEKKAKSWGEVKLSASAQDLTAEAKEESPVAPPEERRFVARGNRNATGSLHGNAMPASGSPFGSKAELVSLEEAAELRKKREACAKASPSSPASPNPEAPTLTEAGQHRATENADVAKTEAPSSIEKPSSPQLFKPAERSTFGAYKPQLGGSKLPTSSSVPDVTAVSESTLSTGSGGAYKPPSKTTTTGAYKPPERTSTTGAFKPSETPSSTGAYRPQEKTSTTGAYRPPEKTSTAGAYQPPDASAARSIKPFSSTTAAPPTSGGAAAKPGSYVPPSKR